MNTLNAINNNNNNYKKLNKEKKPISDLMCFCAIKYLTETFKEI